METASPSCFSRRNYFLVNAEFDYHALVSFVIDQEMAMAEKAPVVLQVRTRDRLAPRVLGSPRRRGGHLTGCWRGRRGSV
jgi:uncharacterized protein (DUF1499 family)